MAEIEIAVEILTETPKAYRVSDGVTEAWIPKSQVTDYCETNGAITSIFIHEWLAHEKGLI